MNLWDGFRTVIGQAENGSLLPDRLVGSGHPLSVSRDRIRYAPGTVTALTRSADAAGVLVVGGLLTLLTWVVTPIWVGGALLFPRSSCSRRWRSPPRSLRGCFRSRPHCRDRNRERRRRTTLRRVERASTETASSPRFECRPPRAARAWGRARSARDRRSRERARRSASVAEPVRAALGGGAWRPSARSRAGSSGRSPRRISSRSRTSGRRRSRRSPRPDASATTAFTRAASAVSLALRTYATAWLVAAATLGAGYTLAGPFVPLVVGVARVFVVHVAAHGLYGRVRRRRWKWSMRATKTE